MTRDTRAGISVGANGVVVDDRRTGYMVSVSAGDAEKPAALLRARASDYRGTAEELRRGVAAQRKALEELNRQATEADALALKFDEAAELLVDRGYDAAADLAQPSLPLGMTGEGAA